MTFHYPNNLLSSFEFLEAQQDPKEMQSSGQLAVGTGAAAALQQQAFNVPHGTPPANHDFFGQSNV